MISRLLACLAVCLAFPAVSQEAPVPVRTADHSGFTRIVVDFSDRPDWQLGRVGEAYELRLEASGIRFDLSGVYRRIARARLSSLTEIDSGLRIGTACTCYLETEQLANGGLVIDIRDGPPPPGNRYERDLDNQRAGPVPRPAARATPSVRLPVIGPGRVAQDVLPMTTPEASSQAASDLGAQLSRKIREAVAMDLVSPAADGLPEPGDIASRPPDPSAQQRDPPMPPQGANLRVMTDVERARGGSAAVATPVAASECRRFEKLLNPATWAQPGTGAGGIEIRWDKLVDIQGQTSVEGHLSLAKQLLYLTFGREAGAVLMAVQEQLPEASTLFAIADLVDGGQPSPNPLRGLASCPGHTGLWGILADPQAELPADATLDAVPFAAWPVTLRRALGPRLVTALRDGGQHEAARAVFRVLARVADPDDPAFRLVAVDFAETPAPPDKAQTAEEIAKGSSPQTAAALLDVIDARIAEEVPVGTELAMQAGALAFETMQGPVAESLHDAEVRALIHDGHWRAAMARIASGDADATRPQRLSDLVVQAATRAGDGDLLWLVAQVEGDTAVSDPARLVLAERLLALGLPTMAKSALDVGAAIPTVPQRRLLAQIATTEDRLDVAEAYLAGLGDPETLKLRAEIDLRRERDDVLAAIPVSAPEVDLAEAAPTVAARAGGITLSASRALLDRSEQLRTELRDLLTAPGAE